MSKFDRKELSPRVCWILKMIESYTEERHTQGSRFINANTQQKWELLEDILTEQVQEVQAVPVALAYPHEQMDALAISRYKVVPSDQSMYWRHAVVAGDGQQHLYNGSEVDCQNLARKFAGAFLDGAFAFHSLYTALQAQPADGLMVNMTSPATSRDRWMYNHGRLAEAERICTAIKTEDDYCVDQGDYMLDSDDCIKVVRGTWMRPTFDCGAMAAAQETKP